MVHVPVGGAVDWSLGGEAEGVEQRLALDSDWTAQLQQSVADPTRPVVHQLQEGGN